MRRDAAGEQQEERKRKLREGACLLTLGWSRVGTAVLTVTLMGLSLVTSQKRLLLRGSASRPFTTRSISEKRADIQRDGDK